MLLICGRLQRAPSDHPGGDSGSQFANAGAQVRAERGRVEVYRTPLLRAGGDLRDSIQRGVHISGKEVGGTTIKCIDYGLVSCIPHLEIGHCLVVLHRASCFQEFISGL